MNGVVGTSSSIKSITLDPISKLGRIDFNKCIVCQAVKQKTKSKNEEGLLKPTSQGYSSLCRDFASFISCKSDSVPSHIESLFESSVQFANLLAENNAVYHKCCRDDFNNQKLKRLENKCRKMRVEDLPGECRQINSLEDFTEIPSQILDNSHVSDVTQAAQSTFEGTYDLILKQTIRLIEDSRRSPEQEFYKLSQLAKTMSERLDKCGFKSCTVHTTRLKNQLLLAIPGLRADKIGREILLSFDENVKYLVSNAINNDTNSNDEILAKAVDILRETYINESGPVFSGSLKSNFCAENTVSKTLVAFISSLTGGDSESSNISENIAQLIQFNSVKNRKQEASYVRHSIQREQPLPVYIGLLVHSLSAKRSLVDELFEMGMSVSYSRVLDIERALAAKVCEVYMKDDCVCPPHLTSGVFTTAAIDNIDHNPRSTSANYSFHGTGISLIQHHSQPNHDEHQQVIHLSKTDFSNKLKPTLPKKYYEIPSIPTDKGEVPLSSIYWNTKSPPTKPLQYVEKWLERNNNLWKEESKNEAISWSAYNSRSCQDVSSYKSTTTMLPLMKDNVNSPSVVRHTMDIVISATQKINPSQTPVWTGDQPVYAIAKQIQWLYPEKYGEDKIVVMLGGLHIEKSFLAVIGTWLEGSGWEDALVRSGITTPGKAEAILKSDHIKRARYAHEVSLAAMNILLFEAFENDEDKEDVEYNDWIEAKRKESAQFQYWITAMELQAILLQFVKSIRTGDIDGYVPILETMCPWYLVTDHNHYGRWLPVFVADLKRLPTKHPRVYGEFRKGHFTSRQTNKKFSCISDDQLHEQNNKMVKESSSLLGMLNDETSLIKWMVSGPEISRLIWEYKNISSKSEDLRHHEDSKWFQSKFSNDVKSLVNTLRDKGPFSTLELTTIGNDRKSMNTDSINSVINASQWGSTKYRKYVLDRLVTVKESIHQTIKQSQLNIFKSKPEKKVNKEKMKLAAANMDSNLFCKLFIACGSREGNVTDFFMHENNQYPPSLSEFGSLRQPTTFNDDMIKCLLKPSKSSQSTGLDLETIAVHPKGTDVPATCLILNAISHVQGQVPMSVMTVKDYSEKIFDKFIDSRCEKYSRVDVLFDVNHESSLEAMTKEVCNEGKYVSWIDNESKLYKTKVLFAKFLSNTKNKTQFLKILASNYVHNRRDDVEYVCGTDEHIVISKDGASVINFRLPIEDMNTRILLHVEDAVRNGHQQVLISTSDFNIVHVAVYAFKYLAPALQKLWVEVIDANHSRVLSIHELYEVHKDKSDLLPFFNAFTGCHTTSMFFGIGKITAWNAWMNFPNLNSAITQLMENGTSDLSDEAMNILEKFTILMYDSSSKTSKLHECRRDLFTRKKKPRTIDRIPPTRDALEQHVKRSLLQSNIWTQCLEDNIRKLEPGDWGWMKQDNSKMYIPVWTTIPIVADHCKELISCKCLKKCNGHCKCVKNRLPCTMLCDCDGKCDSKLTIQGVKKISAGKAQLNENS